MMVLFEKTKYTKYYITEKGEFYSFCAYQRKGKMEKRKVSLNKKRGYVYARTNSGNYQVHRLVASAFIDNPESKYTINHKNGIKTDNRVENLEWATMKENVEHSIKNGTTKQMRKNEGNIKYTNNQCKHVIKRVKSGMKYKEAGKIYNMPYSTVAHLARGSRRKI